MKFSIVDPLHFDEDPNSTYLPDADPDADRYSDFLFNANPNADLYLSDFSP